MSHGQESPVRTATAKLVMLLALFTVPPAILGALRLTTGWPSELSGRFACFLLVPMLAVPLLFLLLVAGGLIVGMLGSRGDNASKRLDEIADDANARIKARASLRVGGSEASNDAGHLLGIVGTFHDIYCEEIRPELVEWSSEWPDFDWGSIEEGLDENPPPFETWLRLWRSDEFSRYDGHEHEYTKAFLDVYSAFKYLETKLDTSFLDDEERADVAKEYRWGANNLVDSIRTMRAFVPYLEAKASEEELGPIDLAFSNAESPDDETSSKHREAAMENLKDLSEQVKRLMAADLEGASMEDLLDRKTQLLGDLDIATAKAPPDPDEVGGIRDEIAGLMNEIRRRSDPPPAAS